MALIILILAMATSLGANFMLCDLLRCARAGRDAARSKQFAAENKLSLTTGTLERAQADLVSVLQENARIKAAVAKALEPMRS